jgi:hypothetical protein
MIKYSVVKLILDKYDSMILKLGRFGQQIRKTWKDLKCGAGGGWKRSVGLIM